MADSDIKNDFTGLPMEDLIGAPLQAACKAQANLAYTTVDFIKNVGFSKEENSKGLVANTVEFTYETPNPNGAQDGSQQKASLTVPLLSIVKTPNLSIQDVNVSFDMEVKSSEVHKDTSTTNTSINSDIKTGIFFCRSNINIKGNISTSRENTRTSDKSAKYHVDLHAADTGFPEGLSRVFDILNSTIVPVVKNTSSASTNSPKVTANNKTPKESEN